MVETTKAASATGGGGASHDPVNNQIDNNLLAAGMY